MTITRTASDRPAGCVVDVCGVRMADTDAACRIFYIASHGELKSMVKDGFPQIKVRDRAFYPVDLCRQWFRSKDRAAIKASAEALSKRVHRAAKEQPKEEWFRKVDDYDPNRPWTA